MSWKRDEVVWGRIKELREDGKSFKQISAEVGLCAYAVRYAWAEMNGRPLNRDEDYPKEKLDRMVEIACNIAKRRARLAL